MIKKKVELGYFFRLTKPIYVNELAMTVNVYKHTCTKL